MASLVERLGRPGDGSACGVASRSFKPGALWGIRLRRALLTPTAGVVGMEEGGSVESGSAV